MPPRKSSKSAGMAKALAAALPSLAPETLTFPAGAMACGIDEVGRGCLAGPVVACAVSLPEGFFLPHLTDSKKLTARQREELAPILRDQALAWGLGLVWPRRIDKINILQATFEAMARAILALVRGDGLRQGSGRLPEDLLVDGCMTIPQETLARVLAPLDPAGDGRGPVFRQRCVVKGDSLVPAISAASIIAKVWRDDLMTRFARRWPGYGFEEHKGYGTASHLAALRRLGPCPLHRLSFRGVLEDSSPRPAGPLTLLDGMEE